MKSVFLRYNFITLDVRNELEGCTVPEHIRCSSYTLNLVTTADIEKFSNFKDNEMNVDFKKAFKQSLKTCKKLWKRQNSNPIHSSAIQEKTGFFFTYLFIYVEIEQ